MSTPKPEAVMPRKTRRARKTLLVVEDEKLIRWSIREALKRDYHVRSAGSAEEALAILPKLRGLDGLLVDVRLPGMDGLALAGQARSAWPKVKVFVMTAYDHQTAPREAFGAHADGYLAKPFSMETLRDMLASHIGGTSA